MAEGRHRAVPGHEGGIVAHRPELLGDRAEELLLVAALEIPAADRTLEQDIADQRELRLRMMEDDVAGRVAGTMADVEGQLADHHLIAIGEPARRLERLADDPVFRSLDA